jgi:chorismate synthase
VGCVLDGFPSGFPLDLEEVHRELLRRRPGQSALTTQRQEPEEIELLSGVFEGLTLGTPIAMLVRNKDARSSAYEDLKDLFRPSHADFSYEAKFGLRDWRGGGRASARETVGRVAAGSVARQLLREALGVRVQAWVSQVGTMSLPGDLLDWNLAQVEAHPTRCPDPAFAEHFQTMIEAARRDGDSLGGVVTCAVHGLPAGWGEPVFDRCEAELAKAMLGIPASKGFEYGSGFAGSQLKGSEHNDPFLGTPEGIALESNHSGGIQGGITVGAPIYFRVAFKPTATIAQTQRTVDRHGESVTMRAGGRHDPCVVPRAVPIVEAMTTLVLADLWLLQRARQGISYENGGA